MSWEPEVEEIKRRVAFAEEMGGEKGIEVQRQRVKLTLRERSDRFADQKSFQ